MTFEDDEAGVRTRDLIGLECLLWGNDYPHHDAIWPHSMKILHDLFVDVPVEEQEQMVWTNTLELYDIDEAALPA